MGMRSSTSALAGFAPTDDYTDAKGREGILRVAAEARQRVRVGFSRGTPGPFFVRNIANTIKKFGAAYDYESMPSGWSSE